ncbi:MAG: nucleoside recognition protein, partial [Chthoniobacterales bacterium]|nr:nucleoside recognition protein [Chthoniobacterales bacterium]
MLNYIWLGLVLLAVIIGGWTDRLKDVTDGAFDGARTAVTIALGLIGIMALWLGVMRLAERAGLVQKIARGLRPLMRRLFPEVPPEHPAMGSMVMNMAANMLGLGNAATPLGLRAMRDLETLNRRPGVATNAMCMFLAINTSSVQLIPTTAIAILITAGSTRATEIIGTAFLATICSTIVGVSAAKFFEKVRAFRSSDGPAVAAERDDAPVPSNSPAAFDPATQPAAAETLAEEPLPVKSRRQL